jgi:hypothetical protein
MPKTDTTMLEMAIVGYQSQLETISAKIADIKAQLGLRGPGRPKATATAATVTDRKVPCRAEGQMGGPETATGPTGEA